MECFARQKRTRVSGSGPGWGSCTKSERQTTSLCDPHVSSVSPHGGCRKHREQVAECQVFCTQQGWHSGTVLTAGDGRAVTDPSPVPGFLPPYRARLVHVRQKPEAGAQLAREGGFIARAVGTGNLLCLPRRCSRTHFIHGFLEKKPNLC